jgi:transcriptional regulator with XRE-family HTH domain
MMSGLVRRRREQLGWSQSDLARAMGSSPSRINKLESSDRSVSISLVLKALRTMGCQVRIDLVRKGDPFSDSSLTKEQRRELSTRLLRRREADRIAERCSVDAGDVEHVLFNLTLTPWQRLGRSFKRAGLRRLSPH